MPIEGNKKAAEAWLKEYLNDAVMEAMDPDRDHPLSLLDKLSKLDYMAESQIQGRAQFSLAYLARSDVYAVYNGNDRRWGLWQLGQRGAQDRHLGQFNSSAGLLRYIVNDLCVLPSQETTWLPHSW